MPMQPSKYEYIPPVQIAGKAKDFTTKVEITQGPNGWLVAVNIASSPFPESGVANLRLREYLVRLAEELGAVAK